MRSARPGSLPETSPPRIAPTTDGGAIHQKTRQWIRPARTCVTAAVAAATPETPMLAPAPAAGLEAAHGVLQGRLASELRLKRTPQLAFEYDPTVERGVRMTQLIDELAPEDE